MACSLGECVGCRIEWPFAGFRKLGQPVRVATDGVESYSNNRIYM